MRFNQLVGKTLVSVDVHKDDDAATFSAKDGSVYRLMHHQDCCESVFVEDVIGDVDDLLDTPILVATEAVNPEEAPEVPNGDYSVDDSATWTFYRLSTIKGTVVIRFFGTSNGYYSERVDFEQVRARAGDEVEE